MLNGKSIQSAKLTKINESHSPAAEAVVYWGGLDLRAANHCVLIFISFVFTPFAPCGCVIVQGKFNDLETKQRQNLYCRL